MPCIWSLFSAAPASNRNHRQHLRLRVRCSGRPDTRQLGLNVEACKADYAEEVDEGPEVLRVTVFNHGDSNGECMDKFTVHLDTPPHRKLVVDTSTGEVHEIGHEPRP